MDKNTISELENQIEFLLAAAMRKCGDTDDARDIVQDTLTAALAFIKKGGTIDNLRGWLLTVLGNKFNDMLRNRYKHRTVVTGAYTDPVYKIDNFSATEETEESEGLRREVAYLSEQYRTIIVRHYFYRHKLSSIASDLGIPEGTVKSRLDYGRKQIKKGFEEMEKYTENSYMPQRLYIRNSGRFGDNEEPMSLVTDDDTLTQNLLLLAYDKPLSVSELARAIGVPSAYIENNIKRLVAGELMKKTGDNKVYTDFIIYDPEDYFKYVKDCEKFAEDTAQLYCPVLKEAINELKSKDFYSKYIERFMVINICELFSYNSLSQSIEPQIMPDRPNNGKWIAFGNRQPRDYSIPDESKGREEYSYSGLRYSRVDGYLGSDLMILNFETSLHYPYKYKGFKNYNSFIEMEEDTLKLLYLMKKGIPPEAVGFPQKMLENIPSLENAGIVGTVEGNLSVLVPCLSWKQFEEYKRIRDRAADSIVPVLTGPMGEYIKGKKKKIPSHLKSVPDHKLLMPYLPNTMHFVFEAIKQGIIDRDLGYPCPETVAVFDIWLV